MNKRQKDVLQHQIYGEKVVLAELEKQYKKALNDINRKIRILESDELTQSRIYRLEYQKALKAQVQAVLEKLHADEYSTIQKFLSDSYTDGFLGTMYDLHGQGVPLVFPVDHKEAVRAILTESKISLGLYEALGVDTVKLTRTISNEITRGIASELAYTDIARNISNAAKAPLSRAKTIVQTESHRIQQASTLDAQRKAKSRGADVVKQWNSTLDGETRPTHRKLDGQIREVEEPFEANGEKAMYPGGFGDPAEDCNCRCVSLSRAKWALGEDELNTLKDRAAFFGLDKTDDFEDFKKKYLKAAEVESQFGVLYGKDAVDVNLDYINSNAYKAKFSKLTNNAKVNDALYDVSRNILKHCDGTEHEDMYLLNAQDGSIFAKVTDTAKKSGIVYTDEFVEKLAESKADGIPIIGIHNHPQGSPPSPDDFRKAFENGYSFGIIPGHNGQLYRYETPKEAISKELCAAMDRDIGIFIEGGTDVDRAFGMVYNANGLIYTIIEGE